MKRFINIIVFLSIILLPIITFASDSDWDWINDTTLSWTSLDQQIDTNYTVVPSSIQNNFKTKVKEIIIHIKNDKKLSILFIYIVLISI